MLLFTLSNGIYMYFSKTLISFELLHSKILMQTSADGMAKKITRLRAVNSLMTL